MSFVDTIDTWGERLQELLDGISPRDRILLLFMAVVLLSAATFGTATVLNKSAKKARARLAAATLAQSTVDQLVKKHADLVVKVEGLDKRLAAGADFTPLTWLETVGNEMQIASNIRSMTERGIDETDYYRAQKIDLVVNDISLRQLVELLHRLQAAPQAIRFNEVRVKTDRKKREELDLRMEIAVLRPVGGA